MRRLIGLLVLVPALLAAAPAAAQQLDPPEVPEVEAPGVEAPDVEVPDADLPGVPDLPTGDEEEGERETEALGGGPFDHACQPIDGEGGIRFCPTGSIEDDPDTDENEDERVPSFDGAPLDVDVTLPEGLDPENPEPAPTIVIMHGYGGNKTDFESASEDGKRAEDDRDFHYNNVHYARRGYVVVNYTARGFGRSCGREEDSNATPACRSTRSYVHLVDQRWEIRDTQYVLGLLADQGFTEPKEIGVTGISYGGGQSVILAFLRNEIRQGALADEDEDPDTDSGSDFVPWRSPGPNLDDNDSGDDDSEKAMEIAAAFPRWPWSDLVASLVPNGRFLQDKVSDDRESRDPLGVPIASFITGLLGLGAESGTYCGTPPRTAPDPPNDDKYEDPDPGPAPDKNPACRDLTSDLNQAFQEVVGEGEPYEGDAVVEAIADELAERHSGYALADRKPAPLLLQSGWTDDLFPPRESLRVYNKVRADHGDDAPVSLQFGDVGHPRASNKEETDQDFNDEGSDFFDEHVMGKGNGPAGGSARAWTQTCPADADPEGPFTASSFRALNPRSPSFGSDAPQTVQADVASPDSLAYDPIANMQDPCAETRDAPPPGGGDGGPPGTAVYRSRVATEGFRMLGLPRVTADIATTGNLPGSGLTGQLDSRLFDVAPDGTQILVSRGTYRLTENQTQDDVTFDLSGNGWCFEPGHRVKLELLGQDAPYLRPSNADTTTVTVSNLDVDLPGSREACGPGSGTPGGGGLDDDGGGSDDDGGNSGGGGSGGGGSGGGSHGGSGGGDSGAPAAPPGPPSTVACLVARFGGPGPDRMFGTAGGDSIQGLGGADRLFGLAGDDCLFGGAGNDRLSGGPGNDRLSGAAGNDVLRGGPGVNAYSAGAGNDRVYSRDGAAQTVFCGAGRDSAWVDAGDRPRGCERVLRPRR